MKVHELIEQLKQYPPDLPVVKINLLIDDDETETLDDNDLEIVQAINQAHEPQPVLMLTFGHYVK